MGVNDSRQTGLDEAVQVGSTAAKVVEGAAKAGKITAAAANGAALGGPYGNMKFMPTGGISAQNAAEYLALPNVLCCGGSWMVPGGLLDAGDFDAFEALALEAAQIVKK